MEVMLEIYRTLKTLKMEWKAKPREGTDGGEGGEGEEGGKDRERDRGEESDKQRRRREEEEKVKKAQELYFVETRCRMDDVMVSDLSFLFSMKHSTDERAYIRFEWIFNCIELTTKTTSSTFAISDTVRSRPKAAQLPVHPRTCPLPFRLLSVLLLQ